MAGQAFNNLRAILWQLAPNLSGRIPARVNIEVKPTQIKKLANLIASAG
jgi:hypothetical protein